MNNRIYGHASVLAAAAAALLSLAACGGLGGNEPSGGAAAELIVSVELDNAAFTRADDQTTAPLSYDLWSYRGFTAGDRLGFLSAHGDYSVDGGAGPFINQPLEYQGGEVFRHESMQVSTAHMDPKDIYMYMPYGGSVGNPVIELRSNRRGDKVLRCIDYLEAKGLELEAKGSNSVQLTGTLVHAFSELIIMRGEGFDKPLEGKDQITVVMRDGYSHMRIKLDDPWTCTPTLTYEDGYGIAKEECRRWQAWKGTNFAVTETDNVGVEAWYVILPTLAANTQVEHIELYDNEGQLQRVTALKLANRNSKYLTPGWRYPMEITMKELVPTVNPYPIQPWEGDTEITNERKRGIYTEVDFGLWAQYYASYLEDNDKTAYRDKLLQYGDLVTDSDGNPQEWHFYLLGDLDFDKYNYGGGVAVIPELRDVLDGVSTTLLNHEFINHRLSNLRRPLVGTLTGNGALQNMDFVDLNVDTESSAPVGAVACTVEGGRIDHCRVMNGTLIGKGPVGMIAGELTGGSVVNCYASGFMIGADSYAPAGYLFGKEPAAGSEIHDNTSIVQFN